MSLATAPSMSTLLKFELPPRMNSDVAPPRAPVCTTCAPGTSRSASSTSGLFRASSVVESSTVTGAPVCACEISVAAAVTTTCLLERAHLQRDVDDVGGAGADVGLIRGVRLEAGQRRDDLIEAWCDTGERITHHRCH